LSISTPSRWVASPRGRSRDGGPDTGAEISTRVFRGRVTRSCPSRGRPRSGPIWPTPPRSTTCAKLLGQVALTRRASERLNDGGSITLTGGTFTEPIPGSGLGALVNAGLEGFVRSAAAELPRGLRINVVSPGWISETLEAMGEDGGRGTPVAVVAEAYRALVDGDASGTTVVPR